MLHGPQTGQNVPQVEMTYRRQTVPLELRCRSLELGRFGEDEQKFLVPHNGELRLHLQVPQVYFSPTKSPSIYATNIMRRASHALIRKRIRTAIQGHRPNRQKIRGQIGILALTIEVPLGSPAMDGRARCEPHPLQTKLLPLFLLLKRS